MPPHSYLCFYHSLSILLDFTRKTCNRYHHIVNSSYSSLFISLYKNILINKIEDYLTFMDLRSYIHLKRFMYFDTSLSKSLLEIFKILTFISEAFPIHSTKIFISYMDKIFSD